ncbi:Potassium transport protein, high-affinity [Metarhizium album ARSEF 1941]|uniref:Potassium transport protein, high-affinity n=1 Tax=Metarhizium album (strain ARSEF 1941) TaxID=1081103 RepID=A0A0B2WMF4_METAS|nr:Potassium transport protein, high-affinity [Metarhizium album ARSEF 1941]KHN97226.1 Potassium transport protein, high-affinity [Metarhizium album ARSEF 1941]
MWCPSLNYITLHYAYIFVMGLLSLPFLYLHGNMSAMDAYFMGVSASTESGLNVLDLNELRLYQQIYLYCTTVFTQMGFTNILVVVVRLYWFNKHLSDFDPREESDLEFGEPKAPSPGIDDVGDGRDAGNGTAARKARKTCDDLGLHPQHDTLTDRGGAEIASHGAADMRQHDPQTLRPLGESRSLDRAAALASSVFVIGREPTSSPMSREPARRRRVSDDMPYLSSGATVGRNSQFYNLTRQDRNELGGIEYRSLKLLLKVVVVYYFGVHLVGAIGLVGWILQGSPKYAAHLAEFAQDKIWWAFYTSQTAVCNLGFTLTPDSMLFFRDAPWVMFWLSLLTFAGNTLYPVFLRCILWTMSKMTPRRSSIQEPLQFLLAHPRRCYALLFPCGTTWALFGIIMGLNLLGTLILLVLDLHNPEFTRLTAAQRVAAAFFQSAAARHTGAASFTLSSLSPGAQFTLLVMMYISAFPVAMSIRSSNIYEEKSLGYYAPDPTYDEDRGATYLLQHMQKQLGFDLWYIFLGLFCLSVSEASKLADPNQPAFSFFALFFEVVSAYGGVGLTMGYPGITSALSTRFTTFGKVVMCAMMIRGRHRGMPHGLDRAIMLPGEWLEEERSG